MFGHAHPAQCLHRSACDPQQKTYTTTLSACSASRSYPLSSHARQLGSVLSFPCQGTGECDSCVLTARWAREHMRPTAAREPALVVAAQACIAAGGLEQQELAAGERLQKLMASAKRFTCAKVRQNLPTRRSQAVHMTMGVSQSSRHGAATQADWPAYRAQICSSPGFFGSLKNVDFEKLAPAEEHLVRQREASMSGNLKCLCWRAASYVRAPESRPGRTRMCSASASRRWRLAVRV